MDVKWSWRRQKVEVLNKLSDYYSNGFLHEHALIGMTKKKLGSNNIFFMPYFLHYDGIL